MKKRGRKSASELLVAAPSVEAVLRPDAPYDLTDEQADEWRAIVEAMHADWFPRETHSLLAQYCRHVIASRRIAQLVHACEGDSADQFDIGAYDRLLKMAEREGRAMSSLATRLRMTTQATVRAESARKGTQVKKPWS